MGVVKGSNNKRLFLAFCVRPLSTSGISFDPSVLKVGNPKTPLPRNKRKEKNGIAVFILKERVNFKIDAKLEKRG